MAKYYVGIDFTINCKKIDANKLRTMIRENWNLHSGKDNLWIDEENFPVRYTNMDIFVDAEDA